MKNKRLPIIKWILAVYLGITVILPLIMLIGNIKLEDIKAVISTELFIPMVKNSLFTTTATMFISVSIAFLLAYLQNRTSIKGKSIWGMIFVLPMLIPSISHGMGLILLFGDNGLLTNLLGVNVGLYGYTGIIMGSVLYSFPVAFLMLNDAFQYEDYTVYESAEVLGISKMRQFMCITMPNMRQALISSTFAVFTMVFTDYGVPLMTGGKVMTLPVYMYREVVGLMNYSSGAFIGILLLVPALIAFLFDLKKSSDGNVSTVTKSFFLDSSKKKNLFAYFVCSCAALLISLPIIAFVILSFVEKYPVSLAFSLNNIKKALTAGVGMFLINSIAIALMTALLGTCLTYFLAYITTRTGKSMLNTTLHLIAMISLAIPGVVLGLAYVFTFKGTYFYTTILILIVVNTVHFFSSPYLLAYNSLMKFNENLEDIAQTLGIGHFKMLHSVYIPSTQETIIEMYGYMFVNSMMTISAVSFLANFKTMPLALLIPQLEAQSFMEGAAFVSLIILLINLSEKLIASRLKKIAGIHANSDNREQNLK